MLYEKLFRNLEVSKLFAVSISQEIEFERMVRKQPRKVEGMSRILKLKWEVRWAGSNKRDKTRNDNNNIKNMVG